MSIPHTFAPLGNTKKSGPPGWAPTPGLPLTSNLRTYNFLHIEESDVVEMVIDLMGLDHFAVAVEWRGTPRVGPCVYGRGLASTTILNGSTDLLTYTIIRNINPHVFILSNGETNVDGTAYSVAARPDGWGRTSYLDVSRNIGIYKIAVSRGGEEMCRYVPYAKGTEVKLYDEIAETFLQ